MNKYWLFIVCIFYSSSAITSTWQLVYSSNFNGELKLYGCSIEGNLGGILRRATKLNEIKSHNQDAVLVSAGDVLGPVTEQGVIKASYMHSGIASYQMDAILPGEQDLAYDEKLLLNRKLPRF